MVALIDSDRIHDLLGLPMATCRPEVLRTFREHTGAPDSLRVVLLERNVEDLVRSVGEILGIDRERLSLAVDRKRINERDRILNRCATGDPVHRKVLLDRMPSFARLVGIVAGSLGQPGGSGPGPARD